MGELANDSYGMYWVGKRDAMNPYAEQYLGEWDPWMKGAFALYRAEENKVDEGEVVKNGFQIAKRKKFHDNRIVRFEEPSKPKPKMNARNLMAVRPKEDAEMETVRVDAVMDSGAFDTVIPKQMLGGNELRETRASREGWNWTDVQGKPVKNVGEGDLKAVSEDGIPIEFTAQVGEGIKKMLLSVKRACQNGNMIIFGANLKAIRELAKHDTIENNVIVGTKSGVKSEIKEKNGMYVYPMTITRKKGMNDMDLGMMAEEGQSEYTQSKTMTPCPGLDCKECGRIQPMTDCGPVYEGRQCKSCKSTG